MKYKVNFDVNLEGAKQNVKGNIAVEVEMTAEEFINSMGNFKDLVTFVTREFKEIKNQESQEKIKNKEDEDGISDLSKDLSNLLGEGQPR